MVNRSIWPIDGILTGTTCLNQSVSGSNGNEGVIYITQSCRTTASPSDVALCHTQDTCSILPIDGTGTSITNSGQNVPGINGKKEQYHNSQSGRNGTSILNEV